MARICAACRQPLDGDPRQHDCPVAGPDGLAPDDGEDAAV